jgi:hypothetical protein
MNLSHALPPASTHNGKYLSPRLELILLVGRDHGRRGRPAPRILDIKVGDQVFTVRDDDSGI